MNKLCKSTKKLLKLLDSYNISITNQNISENKYFMELYKNIQHIMLNNIKIKNIIKNPIKFIKITLLQIVNINNYLEDNEFTSVGIKKSIINDLKYGYEIKYDNNIIVYFSKNIILSNKIPIVIIHMFTIIILLKILFNRDTSNNIQKVIYFETENKKRFPKDNNVILGPHEVNSGLTFLDFHKNGDIILYRKEEILKVLIHELIHSNLIDQKIIYSDKIKNFSNAFCVNYNILLNEAFTETFATLINLFYIHIIGNLDIKYLNTMFKNELRYSTYICSKIIKYYNINKIEHIIKNKNNCIKNFPQKTNVFAYYILKNILLNNHITFSTILSKHTLNYKVNNELCITYIINLISSQIKELDKSIINIKSDKNNSLRLCLYELNIYEKV
jgi:hypothetical protein